MNVLERPFLEGKRVLLRSLLESDLRGEYFGWFHDPEVCRFNSHGRFPNSEQRMESYFKHATQSSSDLILAMIDRATGKHVGNISLQHINWVDRNAEFAVILGDKSVWGKGYAAEAAQLLVKHGFEVLNLHRIYCGTSEKNEGMQKLAASMKMKEEGRQRQAIFKEGRYYDVLLFGVLREEFLSG